MAQAKGVVDLARMDLEDPRSWLKLRWLGQELQRQAQLDQARLLHAHHLAGAAVFKAEAGLNCWKAAGEALELCELLSEPWKPRTARQEASARATGQMLDTWEREFGSMADPTTQQRIADTVAYLREHTA